VHSCDVRLRVGNIKARALPTCARERELFFGENWRDLGVADSHFRVFPDAAIALQHDPAKVGDAIAYR
jgi:hypothetical protein